MKKFIPIITVIAIIAFFADQHIYIKQLQTEAVKRERDIYNALCEAKDAQMRLRENINTTQWNEAKMLQVAKILGLKNISSNMGGN